MNEHIKRIHTKIIQTIEAETNEAFMLGISAWMGYDHFGKQSLLSKIKGEKIKSFCHRHNRQTASLHCLYTTRIQTDLNRQTYNYKLHKRKI